MISKYFNCLQNETIIPKARYFYHRLIILLILESTKSKIDYWMSNGFSTWKWTCILKKKSFEYKKPIN